MTKKDNGSEQPPEKVETLIVDVCGQPGGPSPEEQAMVDEEQRQFMARRKAEWEAAVADERARGVDVGSKVERAKKARNGMAALVKRIEALEAKVNG